MFPTDIQNLVDLVVGRLYLLRAQREALGDWRRVSKHPDGLHRANASVNGFDVGSVWPITPGLQHYVAVPVSVSVTVSVTVSVKTASVPAVPYAVVAAVRSSSATGPGGRPPSFSRK